MGSVRVPAFVDIHVHFREPGYPAKEDIESGVRAAAAGGYRAVCMMPNTLPAIDGAETLLRVDRRGRGFGGTYGVHVFAASAMTIGQKGRALVDFDAMDRAETLCRELTGHGVCGITEDGMTLRDEALMERVCAQAVRLGIPVMDHAEPEAEIVRRDIAFAKRTGARFHIQHVSLAESVELLREAKAQGVPATCETAPHYFALTEADANCFAVEEADVQYSVITEQESKTDSVRKNTNAKMNPPLRSERDRCAVIEGLADGTIDCIATDHAPHEAAAKDMPFEDAANGIIGLETAFPVAYTFLVKNGPLSLGDLVRLMSTRPAEIIGLPPAPDVLVELDLETPWVIDAAKFCSKGRNTPFDGMRAYGKILERVINGGGE